jgi:TPR repeat protein
VPPNTEEALYRLRCAAMRGDAAGQVGLAVALAEGRAGDVDLVEAYAWVLLSGERGGSREARSRLLIEMAGAEVRDAAQRRADELRERYGLVER